MPYLKPDQLDAIIRSRKIGGLYVFDGPDAWLKERSVQAIIDALIPPEFRDFNLERWDASTTDVGPMLSSAQSFPFMGDRRLLIVQNADDFAAADGRMVGEALANLPASTCMIFLVEGKANLRDAIPAQVGSHGAIVTFWTPFPNQLPSWVVSEAKRRGKAITMDAAAHLAEACADLRQIADEVEKLSLFVGAKKTIDGADLRAHGLPDAQGDYKDLENAVWDRNVTEALRQGQLLADMGVRAEAILPALERILRQLVIGHFLKTERKADWEAVCSAVGARGKMQQEALGLGLRAYGYAEAKKAYSLLAQADYDVKTGRLPSEMAVSLLILNVCAPAARRVQARAGAFR